MKLIYPEEKELSGYLADLIDKSKDINAKDYLYMLGSVLADKMLPRLDPTLHYTIIYCAEDCDDFAQGFIERIDDVIQMSQMVFWMSDLRLSGGETLPLIRHRYVEKEYTQSHEVIFLKPFILESSVSRASLLDIADRIKPSKLHLAGLFIDTDVKTTLESDFGEDYRFDNHSFVEVSKLLGERAYVWTAAEKDMYRSLGYKSSASAMGLMPETIKKKMLIRN